MFSGRRGWFRISTAVLISILLPWAAGVTIEDLRDTRVAAWSLFIAGVIAGALFQVRLHGHRLGNVAQAFAPSVRARHRRNASVGAGVGIFIAALLRGFDSAWLFVALGGLFTGVAPVWAGMSAYMMRKYGHTL